MLEIERVSIVEVLDIREVLGRESVRIAATFADPADIDTLRQRLEVLEDGGALPDVEAVIVAIASFRRGLSAAAHNPLLLTLERVLINLLLNQITALRTRGVRFWRERSARFQPDRGAIVHAIAGRDP
jgi:DNA-binding GntR family transcriptional regulator